jgi:drug/metabolite transporter (DMT)-like permease
MLICSALLVAYAAPTGAIDRALQAPQAAWLWLIGSTLSSIVIGDSLYFMAAARIGVARALPIASAFPLLSTLGAVLLLNEPPTVALLAGSALIVLAVALIVLAVALIGGERARGSARNDVVGLLLAGLAACMWASSGLFLGPALRLLDPTAANTIRFALATVVFTSYLVAARPVEHFDRRLAWLTLAAAIGTLCSSWMFVGGVAGAGVARGVALNATSPVFSAILAAVLLHERVSRRTALGIAASVIGTLLLVV